MYFVEFGWQIQCHYLWVLGDLWSPFTTIKHLMVHSVVEEKTKTYNNTLLHIIITILPFILHLTNDPSCKLEFIAKGTSFHADALDPSP